MSHVGHPLKLITDNATKSVENEGKTFSTLRPIHRKEEPFELKHN